MKNSLTTSDIRDLTNEGTEFGVDNRAINELLHDAQEREEFEAWLDSRMDDARAHMDAKWAEQEERSELCSGSSGAALGGLGSGPSCVTHDRTSSSITWQSHCRM